MMNKIEILLVEDSPSDIRLTEEALKRSDLQYELKVVHDGVEATEYLSKAKGSNSLPDVILLDLNMPKKNGHEVLADIKDDPALKKIPVILLTVSQRDEDVMDALKLKLNYYIAKPITSQKLSTLLRSIHDLENEISDPSSGSEEETLIRMVLACNPHTSPTVLKQLATDKNEKVRSRVAENPNVSPSILQELAKDISPEVRLSAAENPNLPASVLESLANDPNEDVRLGLSSNRKVPVHILQQLAEDENVYVSSTANKTLAEVCKQ